MPRRPTGFSFVSWADSKYRVLGALGDGGSSEVYHALATSGRLNGVQVAIKVFTAPDRKGWRAKFMREMSFLRTCDHPAILRIYDDGEDQEQPFIVSEYQPDTLKTRSIRAESIANKISYTMQLLSALRYLARHDPPIVHRDIKPANIFFKGPSCVLGDFGLLFTVNEGGAEDLPPANHVPPRVPEMARAYRTPELVEAHITGVAPPPASDVFQLGLVVAEMFTDINPCIPSGPHKPVELREIPRIEDKSGEAIRQVIQRMLVLAAEDRPGADELIRQWQDLYSSAVRNKGQVILSQRSLGGTKPLMRPLFRAPERRWRWCGGRFTAATSLRSGRRRHRGRKGS